MSAASHNEGNLYWIIIAQTDRPFSYGRKEILDKTNHDPNNERSLLILHTKSQSSLLEPKWNKNYKLLQYDTCIRIPKANNSSKSIINRSFTVFRIQYYLAHIRIQGQKTKTQWKPLNLFTLGPVVCDHINQMITITDDLYLVAFSK